MLHFSPETREITWRSFEKQVFYKHKASDFFSTKIDVCIDLCPKYEVV